MTKLYENTQKGDRIILKGSDEIYSAKDISELAKEDLKNKLLILKNPNYQSGLYRIHTEYVKTKMNSK